MLLAAIIPGRPAQIYVWETHDVFFFFFFFKNKAHLWWWGAINN